MDPQHTPVKTKAGGCAMSIHVRDGHIIAVSFTQIGYTLAYINKIWSAQIFSWHFVSATKFSGLRGIEELSGTLCKINNITID